LEALAEQISVTKPLPPPFARSREKKGVLKKITKKFINYRFKFFKFFGMQERRILQINELIKRELGKIIKKELDVERETLVTVADVDFFYELSEAKVWLSIYPFKKAKKILEKIEKIKNNLMWLLNKKISFYRLIKLKFLIDETEEKASEIEKILDPVRSRVHPVRKLVP